MLPKQHRLTQEKDFKRVMQQGRSFFIAECGIKVAQRKKSPRIVYKDATGGVLSTRIGIVVPKKLTRTIAKRNRIKRQVRHIFLKLLGQIPPHYDIVFLAREGFLTLEFAQMEEKIVEILKNIVPLRGNPLS